jgi:CheY-like chemotaxis protein
MSISREEFLQNLGESGLFPSGELLRLLSELPGNGDGSFLAQQLIDGGQLTRDQADAVLNRQFDKLRFGNYDVLTRLGAGGMGTVYKARHRRLKRIVALKVPSPEVVTSASFIQRFTRECETLAQLTHPNIVMAFDADEAGGAPFLVMEFVDGRDLATEVLQNGPLSGGAAVSAILQAARGLAYAHTRGIIHRDVKPSNLLRDVDGNVKVADLGLARLTNSRRTLGGSGVSQVGAVVGTLDFMSPEQALDSSNIDHRADIYSLGCTLFFLLMGRPPYEGATPMAALLRHSTASIPSLREERPDLPAELDAIFQRMLCKSPDERYSSMKEVVRALEGLAGLTNLPPLTAPPPASATDTELSPTVQLTPGKRRNDPAAATPAAAPAAASATAIDRAVIIAEPSRTLAAIIRNYLQQLGREEVHCTTFGREALALLTRTKARVLLSAMHLADMTALELARALRGDPATAGVGLIVVTSQTDAGQASPLAKDDRTALMYKPFDQEELAQSLARVTGQPGGEPESFSHRPVAEMHVLIVDDSNSARSHVQAVLRGLGFTRFSEAKTGAEAVPLLGQKHFDLIVTDYNMPEMNGEELTLFIRRQPALANVPIVLFTTETDPGLHERVRQAGVSAICPKSFKPEVVRGVLTRLL